MNKRQYWLTWFWVPEGVCVETVGVSEIFVGVIACFVVKTLVVVAGVEVVKTTVGGETENIARKILQNE